MIAKAKAERNCKLKAKVAWLSLCIAPMMTASAVQQDDAERWSSLSTVLWCSLASLSVGAPTTTITTITTTTNSSRGADANSSSGDACAPAAQVKERAWLG